VAAALAVMASVHLARLLRGSRPFCPDDTGHWRLGHRDGNDRVVRVIIVGGGIGGLSAAIAFRKAAHEVVVLERAPRIERAGAGITIFANGMHALGRLGVASAVASRAAPVRRSAVLTCGGRELASVPAALLAGTVAIHRAKLQAVLAEEAGELRLGQEVIEVQQDDREIVARTAGATEERGDLLVGADGLHSVVRRVICDARPRRAGYTAWRGVAAVAVAPGRLTESWGVGERFGLVDIGQGWTYWFATKNAPEHEHDVSGWQKAEITARFGAWHEPIAEVLDATEEAAILRNDVSYLEPLPSWSGGRVVLLGDAAHATTPGLGQGAALAIEDAVVLADCLAGGLGLGTALHVYESVRRPRAKAVLRRSRQVDRAAQLASPFACRVRDALVAHVPAAVQRRQLQPIVSHRV
jgi:2-polyprenyl-6-methoxyphenol hydroxylase-like FAD-dependent oxidoreductase